MKAQRACCYRKCTQFVRHASMKTPREIVDNLNREINAALADPQITAQLADLAVTALPGSPADFAKLIADETEKCSKVVRAANIKPT